MSNSETNGTAISDRENRGTTNGFGPHHESFADTEYPKEVNDLRRELQLAEERYQQLQDRFERLRARYERTYRARSRQSVVGLAAVGLLAGITAFVIPSAAELLLTIAAAGLFAAVLSYTLVPDQFLPTDLGEGLFASQSSNLQALVNQLGLSNTRVYVSTDAGPRLFVPELEAYNRSIVREEPDRDALGRRLREPFVVSELAAESGLSIRPTASSLLTTFEEQHGNEFPADIEDVVITLQEGVTDVFELARVDDVNANPSEGRATFEVSKQLFGSLNHLDHPVTSFLGSGLAEALSKPVEISVEQTDEKAFVTCRWPVDSADEEADESLNGSAGDQ